MQNLIPPTEREIKPQYGTVQDVEPEAILRVKSKTPPRDLSTSIIAVMRNKGYAQLRCIGDGAIGRGVKGAIIASGALKIIGIDLIMVGSFGMTEIEGKDMTVTKINLEAR